MTFEDTANATVRTAMDQGRQAADIASQAVKDGYDAAQQYVKDKGMDLDLRDFVRREPWLAIAAAFAVGYFAAQIHKVESAGLDPATTAAKVAAIQHSQQLYQNPLVNMAYTFMEPLPVGLIITLISAAILRRKTPAAPSAARAVMTT